MKNLKTKAQKGFSLVELMVVIAIIAILAAVAIPMYSNYTTRAQIGSELSKLGGAKMEVGERISNAGTAVGATPVITAPTDLPADVTVGTDGIITQSITDIVSGASLTLTPTVESGAVVWTCGHTGTISTSQLPSNCS